MARPCSAAAMVMAGGVLESGAEKAAKERVESDDVVLWVLRHARVGVLGCCSEPAMMAARWWPACGSGCVAEQGSSSARGRRAAVALARRMGGQREQDVSSGRPSAAGSAAQRRRPEEQSRQAGRRWKNLD